jgi:MoaA/NifB/PqqE/SkfB family radical SAM enzyme
MTQYEKMSHSIRILNSQNQKQCVIIDAIHQEVYLRGCKAGDRSFTIRPDGSIILCPAINYPYASIYETNFDAIVNNTFVRSISQLKKELDGCLLVDHRSILQKTIDSKNASTELKYTCRECLKHM